MIRADHFLNVPLALLPSETEKILRTLHQNEPRSAMFEIEAPVQQDRSYDLIAGIAVISISGILVHQEDWCSWMFGEMSYDRIRAQFDQALGDAEAKVIALHVNSPGGLVSGCFDLAEHILAARGTKPIVAILDECAFSAAYALACTAERIVVPRTGGVGSIGVVMLHDDITKALDEFGIKVTTFQFGERKTDSYPTTPLTEEARKAFQSDVDTLGEMFVDLVARARDLKPAAVGNTEAACFLGQAGVDVGLADAVMSPQAAFAALLDEIA